MPGVHSISQRKKSLLPRTALAYLNRLHERPETYRFDIISIAYGQSKDYKFHTTGMLLYFDYTT